MILRKNYRSDDRQVIVTTIQKMQILVSKRLQEGTPEYNKIKNLKIAFVVDECHRAVTPKQKENWNDFLANLYGMDLPAHRDLLKILSTDGRFAENYRRIIW